MLILLIKVFVMKFARSSGFAGASSRRKKSTSSPLAWWVAGGHKALLKRVISPGPLRRLGSRTLFVRFVGWGLDLEGRANESEQNPRHRASGLSRMRLGEWVEAWIAAIVSRTVLAFCRINFFGKSGSSFSK